MKDLEKVERREKGPKEGWGVGVRADYKLQSKNTPLTF